MKKILVTTDFSKNSKAGIRFAIQLASQTPFELIFYHVDDRSDIDVWTDTQYSREESMRNANQQIALRTFVHSIYKQLSKPIGEVGFIVDNKPEADAAIISYAKKINADYICMSTRGGGVVDKFLGTNAERLITTSPVPVFVIPHTYRSKPIRSFLYASDMEQIETELKAIKILSDDLDANVNICHYETVMDMELVENRLESVYAKNSDKRISVHFRKFFAEHSLLDHLNIDIRRLRPSVLVMFTKQNRNWYERIFLSSKTAEMGFDTKTPLLVYRK